MVWQPEIDEMEIRMAFAKQMGGEEGIAVQHGRGKLTIRERLDLFCDEDSFQEIGRFAGTATYDGEELVKVQSSNSVIGTCELDGRKVVLNGGDFTVRGGASDATIGNKGSHAQNMAKDWRLPYIRLLDAAGGSVKTFEQIGRTYIPTNPITPGIEKLLCEVPVVSAALGSVAGLPAVDACLSHFNVMVKGISQVFAGGPPVVKATLGIDISKEELGDEPGFLASPDQQARGIVRAGARIVTATLRTQMPWISIIIRQLYGVAGQCHDRPSGMFKRVAWPSGHWGSMHISGGVSAAYRRVIDEADDPDAKRAEIEAQLDALASPFRTAEAFNIEDIMDPRDTRPMLCEFMQMAQQVIQTQLGPTSTPYSP